jgi:hypothetical protein
MHRSFDLVRTACVFMLFSLPMIACGSTSNTPTQTVPAQSNSAAASPTAIPILDTLVPSASASTATDPRPSSNFKVAVVVDTLSEPVRREQAQSIFEEASRLIQPFVPISFEMIDFVEDSAGGTTADMANRYVASHSAALPNGILIFSFGDGGQAKLHDGYGFTFPAPAGYRNTYVSPVAGEGHIYVAVVRFGLKYMACGYGGTDAVQSATSIGGECRDRSGTACVQNNGYSMCSDAVRSLYATTPTHFVTSTMIHEFLHLFSPGGDKDNYATPECNARMGYPDGFFDLQESQYYNGTCPFVYEVFAASYHP